MPDAIVARSLVKRYVTWERRGLFTRRKRSVEALRGVSFSTHWGEVFGLLGPNGAGKTTTVKILSTLLLPDGGSAEVAGFNVVEEPVRVRDSIGVVLSVERGFFWKLTGRENLRYFGMLRGLRGRVLDERVSSVLRLVGLEDLGAADKLYEEYSLGMKARLALARALLHDPRVLILDEPTLGLDPVSARRIRELVVRLAHEEKRAVLITTHNMFEAEIICDRVAIIDEGVIKAVGTPGELKAKIAHSIPVVIRFRGEKGPEVAEKALRAGVEAEGLGIRVVEDGYVARILVRSGEEEEVLARAIEVLTRLGFSIRSVEVSRPSLEDVFVAVTSRRERG